MDNYNFTKGKWYYEENYDEKYRQPTFRIGTENLSEFITIWSGLDCYDEIDIETKANALLISKAPEILEKLSEIVNILDIKCTDGCVNKTWGDFQNGNGEDVGLEIDKFIKEAKQLIKEVTEL